jgi:hypothetical protein
MKRIVLGVAVIACLTACGRSDVDHDAFVSAVRSDVPAFDQYSDDALADIADVACHELASVPAVAAIEWSDDISENDREHLVYLALTEGCPEDSHPAPGS